MNAIEHSVLHVASAGPSPIGDGAAVDVDRTH